jgi:hypothetical protein
MRLHLQHSSSVVLGKDWVEVLATVKAVELSFMEPVFSLADLSLHQVDLVLFVLAISQKLGHRQNSAT